MWILGGVAIYFIIQTGMMREKKGQFSILDNRHKAGMVEENKDGRANYPPKCAIPSYPSEGRLYGLMVGNFS